MFGEGAAEGGEGRQPDQASWQPGAACVSGRAAQGRGCSNPWIRNGNEGVFKSMDSTTQLGV